MNILFLSHWYPYPPDNGSKLRVYNLLRGLSTQHRVTLISFTDNGQRSSAPELEQLCEKVFAIPTKSYNPASMSAIKGFFSSKPRVLVDKYVPEMSRQIHMELAHNNYDLVIASQWYMADYVSEIRGIPVIFEEVEVGVFIQKRQASASPLRSFRHRMTEYKLRGYLQNLLPNFVYCTVVSDIERDHLSDLVPGYHRIEVIANGVSLDDYELDGLIPRPNTLIYTGSFRYRANYEAMLWFVNDVLPIIKREVPDIQLTITGDHADLPFPASENVILTGYVDEIRPLIASSWISIAPLLVGGGTRLKVLEAMALRSPVVATSKGVEGVSVQDGEHLLIANRSEDFAQSVLLLLRDAELRQSLASSAYQLIQQHYDWKVIMPEFLKLIDKVGSK